MSSLATCYITRSGPQADALQKLLGSDAMARPVFAAMTGYRFDDVVVTFKIEEPIPYVSEDDAIGCKKAALVREREAVALKEFWPLKFRTIGGAIRYEPFSAVLANLKDR